VRLFGLDIVRCSKRDINEEQVYKKTVVELYNHIVDFLEMLEDLMDPEYQQFDEEQLVQLMFQKTETICKLIIMYEHNKFSTPITAVSILMKMNQLREHASDLQNFMLHHVAAQNHVEDFEQNYEDEYQEEVKDIRQQYQDVNQKYWRTKRHMLKILIADINRMASIVQYDLFKVIFGVDIIRTHKQRHKLPHGVPEFKVQIYQDLNQNQSPKEDII